MPIEVMNKKSCSTLSGEALIALQQVLKKYGVNVTYKGGRFSNQEMKATFIFSIPRPDGVPTSFSETCHKFGLDPSDYGKRFTSGGRVYEIVEIKPQNRKYPIIGRRVSDGQRFKFSSRVLAAGLH